jgi:antibiotic biosynthesis monooxygenase (ABM) superfamily enzyme
MTFLDKIKTGIYWKNTVKISIVFFITIAIISLLFNSFSSIISFDLDAINSENFSDGKWINFFFIKAAVSLLYGMWVTARNIK